MRYFVGIWSIYITICLQVEVGKEKKSKYHTYQRLALVLALIFLILALSVFSLRYLWSPSLGKVRQSISSLFANHQPYCHCLWRQMKDSLSHHISKSYRLHQRKKYSSKENGRPHKEPKAASAVCIVLC